ncbi:molybdopterin converting factor subunit 1 [Aquibacillus sediminis]|uniref:molybdopterin converting factor subunit 1 n=1 Tax=Aquibacillus sediminis TaxID=2574734 RepID=UPI0011091E07|nr:molybdopterin converting factor subunit 1 [Aquibacillus sediminis]
MIKVLLFAHLQEEVGKHQLEVDDTNITVRNLKDNLQSDYQLRQMDQVMVSVNEEYALEDDVVHDGDVVAFIPPVSGG